MSTLFSEAFKPVSHAFHADSVDVSIFGLHAAPQKIVGTPKVLLLLHGYPQNHTLWHLVAAELETAGILTDWHVLIPDLPGYGSSKKLASDDGTHAAHSKRAVTNDLLVWTDHVVPGEKKLVVVGHDRGARVGYRMAKDHRSRVAGLCVQDIVPTKMVYERMKYETGRHSETFGMYHWIFLALPPPIPETLINASSDAYFTATIDSWTGPRFKGKYVKEAMDSWVQQYRDPKVVEASLEDYRAGASIDLDDDERDEREGKEKVDCPLLSLSSYFLEKRYDVKAVWEKLGRGTVEAYRVGDEETGHFLPVEAAEDTARRMVDVKNSHLEDQLEKDEAILATSTSYTPTATLGFASVPTATGVFKQFPELQELIVGNRRFRNETETEHPGEIQELAQAQHPKFAYLGCADSRVPATTIFDADIGDLFVHRNVGNQYAVDDLNSQTVISYAVEHLLVSHIIVMGHYACGAVQAAIASVSKEVNKDNWISPIRRLFDTSNRSEIVEFRKAHADDETVAAPNQTEPAALVEENVAITVSSLAADESVRKMWEEWIISNAGGAEKAKRSSSEKEVPELYIHGMVYDVATGLVTDLGLSLGPSHFIVSSNEGHEEE
ncbi:hypothetical protein MNV49_001699 [Pseudohyphozyma bogoriensis]|nr:hypothetical protein MNV49_001699 [Pseudohyphozyma bogoriensis]